MATEKRLIDANALLEALGYDPMKFWAITPESTFGIVLNAPTVDAAEVVHGRWDRVIPSKSAAKWSTKVSCSNCHKEGYTRFNYCPNCGAKMDGDGNAAD